MASRRRLGPHPAHLSAHRKKEREKAYGAVTDRLWEEQWRHRGRSGRRANVIITYFGIQWVAFCWSCGTANRTRQQGLTDISLPSGRGGSPNLRLWSGLPVLSRGGLEPWRAPGCSPTSGRRGEVRLLWILPVCWRRFSASLFSDQNLAIFVVFSYLWWFSDLSLMWALISDILDKDYSYDQKLRLFTRSAAGLVRFIGPFSSVIDFCIVGLYSPEASSKLCEQILCSRFEVVLSFWRRIVYSLNNRVAVSFWNCTLWDFSRVFRWLQLTFDFFRGTLGSNSCLFNYWAGCEYRGLWEWVLIILWNLFFNPFVSTLNLPKYLFYFSLLVRKMVNFIFLVIFFLSLVHYEYSKYSNDRVCNHRIVFCLFLVSGLRFVHACPSKYLFVGMCICLINLAFFLWTFVSCCHSMHLVSMNISVFYSKNLHVLHC